METIVCFRCHSPTAIPFQRCIIHIAAIVCLLQSRLHFPYVLTLYVFERFLCGGILVSTRLVHTHGSKMTQERMKIGKVHGDVLSFLHLIWSLSEPCVPLYKAPLTSSFDFNCLVADVYKCNFPKPSFVTFKSDYLLLLTVVTSQFTQANSLRLFKYIAAKKQNECST